VFGIAFTPVGVVEPSRKRFRLRPNLFLRFGRREVHPGDSTPPSILNSDTGIRPGSIDVLNDSY
jgi:hypothetical protein